MEQNNDSFQYTYSAKQQEEIKQIRKKYLPKEDDKMEQLRKLDRRATLPGSIVSITVGLIGALIMGFGMSCSLVWTDTMFLPGIIFGLVGMIVAVLAYPLYLFITKKQREKLAPEILQLTDELME